MARAWPPPVSAALPPLALTQAGPQFALPMDAERRTEAGSSGEEERDEEEEKEDSQASTVLEHLDPAEDSGPSTPAQPEPPPWRARLGRAKQSITGLPPRLAAALGPDQRAAAAARLRAELSPASLAARKERLRAASAALPGKAAGLPGVLRAQAAAAPGKVREGGAKAKEGLDKGLTWTRARAQARAAFHSA